MKEPKLLIISYDAVGDNQFEKLLRYPNFSRLCKASQVTRGVSTVFPSNTYPVHTSVITGVEPAKHGITGNTEVFPARRPVWNTQTSLIRSETLWQLAAKKGMRTAAVMWPVTARAGASNVKSEKQDSTLLAHASLTGNIRYNIPEVMARPGKSQLVTSLSAGSKWLQIKEFLRHKHLLSGTRQPNLDRFSTACMKDILKEHAPELALIHLVAYDSLCHKFGLDAPELLAAYDALDECLGILLDASEDEYSIILFSDHAQLPVKHHVYPNEILYKHGYIAKDSNGSYINTGCFAECCGGCAFLHIEASNNMNGQSEIPKSGLCVVSASLHNDNSAQKSVNAGHGTGSDNPAAKDTGELKDLFSQMEGFERFLTKKEMEEAGKTGTIFGIAAKPGYAFSSYGGYEKATHGYPADYEQYKVFYVVRDGLYPGNKANGGCLTDIMPIARGILSI